MKFKLDENFGTRTQQLFREAGHNVQTVHDHKERRVRKCGGKEYRIVQTEWAMCLLPSSEYT